MEKIKDAVGVRGQDGQGGVQAGALVKFAELMSRSLKALDICFSGCLSGNSHKIALLS